MTAGRWEIIKWWELRRIPYTIVVGGVGILSYFIANSIIENYAQTGEEYLNPASLADRCARRNRSLECLLYIRMDH